MAFDQLKERSDFRWRTHMLEDHATGDSDIGHRLILPSKLDMFAPEETVRLFDDLSCDVIELRGATLPSPRKP